MVKKIVCSWCNTEMHFPCHNSEQAHYCVQFLREQEIQLIKNPKRKKYDVDYRDV